MAKIKQTLENLFEPLKLLDAIALRQYTKLGQKWEKKGFSRYSLAHFFNLSGVTSLITMTFFGHPPKNLGHFYGFFTAADLYRNVMEPVGKRDVIADAIVEEGILTKAYSRVCNTARLPALILGLGGIGKGAVGIYSYLASGDPISLNQGLFDIFLGYGLAGLASSIYIKDMNPKLLEKSPSSVKAFLKSIYGKFKENFLPQSLQPEKVPLPKD